MSVETRKKALDKLTAFMDDKEAERTLSKIPGITIKISGVGPEDADDAGEDVEEDQADVDGEYEGLPSGFAGLLKSKKKASLADMMP